MRRTAFRLRDAQRWALAQALSRDGLEGFILCEAFDSRPRAESLLATDRVLLRNLDQLDWEYHDQDRMESFVEREVGAQAMPVAHPVAPTFPVRAWPLIRSVRPT